MKLLSFIPKLAIFLLLLLPLWGQAQCLSGTYTVGGTAPNYGTLSGAVQALTTYGVCGPVTMRIRDGVYVGQIVIGAIAGTSAVNTVSFVGDNGLSSGVQLQYPAQASAGGNYCLFINGASYLNFQNLNIERTGANSYAAAVRIGNGAHHLHFQNNEFLGYAANLTGNNGALVYDDNTINDYLDFVDNTFRFGTNGLHLTGTSVSAQQPHLTVVGNSFIDQALYGVNVYFQDAPELRSNYFASILSSSGNAVALRLHQCATTCTVAANWLTMRKGSAIVLDTCAYAPATPGKIYNNFIPFFDQSGSSDGIKLTQCSQVQVSYNSIYHNTGVYGTCFNTAGGANLELRNNILVGGYQTLFVPNSSAVTVSDHNDFFPYNTFSYRWGGTSYNTLATYQAASGQDANSLSVFPLFSSSGDLHIPGNNDLNAKATPVAGITVDIDGNPRNATTPDIGADEFDLLPNNVGMVDIQNPALPVCASNQALMARFRNTGVNPITSTVLQYTVNGVLMPPYNWSGSLNPGDTSALLNIGSFTFAANTPHDIEVWTRLPNGVSDPAPLNDTLKIDSMLSALSGNYTIGPINCDYTKFTPAIADLIARGVCGPVTFTAMDSTYSEQVVIPKIPGASPTAPITFRSLNHDSSKVVLRFVPTAFGNNWAVKLDGAQYIHFREMSISRYRPVNNNAIPATAILIANGAGYNTFEHCEISVPLNPASNNSTTAAIYATCAQQATQSNDSITFSNCNIVSGSYGIYSQRLAASPPEKGWVLERNTFSKQTYVPMQLERQLAPEIAYNQLADTSVSCNTGITLLYCSNFLIEGNRLALICNNGIGIAACTSSVSVPSRIQNNMVSLRSTSTIFVNTSQYVDIVHNSFRNFSTVSTTYAIGAAASTNLTWRNNIFAQTGGAKAFSTTPVGSTFNYNCWYLTGSSFSTSYSTFAAWQGTGQDANSIFTNPGFYSKIDLHVNATPALNNAGTPTATLPRDIDGEWRNMATPDIGADEFWIPSTLDVRPIAFVSPSPIGCHGSPKIKVSFQNNSALPADTVRAFYIYTKVNNTMVDTILWTGSLAPGDTLENLFVGKYMFSYGVNYTIKVWTARPNYAQDANVANDTLQLVNPNISMGGDYTVGGIFSDFYTLTDAKLAVYSLGVCDSVHFDIVPGVYYEFLNCNGVFPGGSATKHVTYRSQSGIAESVELRALGNQSHILFLTSASWMRFRNMSILQTNTNFFHSVFTLYPTNGMQFTGNIFKGILNLNNCDQALVQGNRFENTTIRFRAGTNNVLDGNRFVNLFDSSVAFLYETNPTFTRNRMDYRAGYGTVENLLFHYCNGGMIERNLMYTMAGSQGNRCITFQTCNANGASTRIVNNRMVVSRWTNGSNDYAADILYTNNLNFYHNTVWLDSLGGIPSSSTAPVFRVLGGSNLNFINNIIGKSTLISSPFYNTGHFIFYTNNLSAFGTVDHNMYYNDTLGAIFAGTTSGAILSFADWQTTTGKDQNSIIAKPHFIADTVFASYGNFNIPGFLTRPELDQNYLYPNQSPYYVFSVPYDFSGRLRSFTNPLYGADEYVAAQNNAAVVDYDRNAMLRPCVGPQPIKVWIVNGGLANLQSVQVHWKVEGTLQAPYFWTGNLPSGDSALVQIGSATFLPFDSLQFDAWTVLPNGFPDPYVPYDTIHFNVRSAMSGTYTVGGANPDFLNFNGAINALHKYGVCGPVVVNVRPGTYNERAWIYNILGSSPVNTVTIQSEMLDSSTVILQHAAWLGTGFPVMMWGTQYFNLRHITIRNTVPVSGSSMYRTIDVNYGAHHVEVSNCRIENLRDYWGGTLAFETIGLQRSTTATSDYVSLLNNVIVGGRVGIEADLAFNSDMKGLVIKGNHFIDQVEWGIELDHARNTTIDGNTFLYDTLYQTRHTSAIKTYLTWDTLRIVGNRFYGLTRNAIDVDNHTGTPTAHLLVANNEIILNQGPEPARNAIYLRNATYVDVHYNSVYNDIPNPNFYSCRLELAQFVTLRNNNFSLFGGGVPIVSSATNFSSDHNNFYTNGLYVGNYLGTNASSLLHWQAQTGGDAHSWSLNPQFPTTDDLHFSNPALENRGQPVAYLPKDIDGTLRNGVTPDLGCYEETLLLPPPTDIAAVAIQRPTDTICAVPADSVFATFKNWGPNVLTFAELHWSINGVFQGLRGWSGTLAPNATSASTFVGTFPAGPGGNKLVRVWVHHPNGGNDPVVANDTVSRSFYMRPPATIPFAQQASVCVGGSVNLNAGSGFVSYQWLRNGAVIPGATNFLYSATTAGNYTVRAFDAHGCRADADTIAVTVNPLPSVSFTGLTPTICANGTPLTLTGNQPTGTFSGNGVVGNTFDPNVAGAGNHSITYQGTDANGCSNTTSQSITVWAPLIPSIFQNGTILSTVLVGLSYQWLDNTGAPIPGATSQTFNTQCISGTYAVQVEDNHQCIGESQPFSYVCVGIDDAVATTMSLAPNPTGSTVALRLENGHLGEITVSIYDMQGRLHDTVTIAKDALQFEHLLDLEQLPAASYLVTVQGAAWLKTGIVVKQ